MYQKIMIMGNLGRAPELRYTPAGQAVTNFSLATNEVWTDGAGQRQERTLWWRISIFGKQAEICNEYLQKGRLVFVEGRLSADPETGGPRLWSGQDGTVRASFEVTAFIVRFIGGQGHANGGPAAASAMQGEPPMEEKESSC
jgi:single-strand DNA-binding protein